LRAIGVDGVGSVICSQGNVIPDLIRRIARQDGVNVGETVVAKKGSTWSLTFTDGRLHAAEYFAPLA
jgi:8-oxo-dGTP diphosphatase